MLPNRRPNCGSARFLKYNGRPGWNSGGSLRDRQIREFVQQRFEGSLQLLDGRLPSLRSPVKVQSRAPVCPGRVFSQWMNTGGQELDDRGKENRDPFLNILLDF